MTPSGSNDFRADYISKWFLLCELQTYLNRKLSLIGDKNGSSDPPRPSSGSSKNTPPQSSPRHSTNHTPLIPESLNRYQRSYPSKRRTASIPRRRSAGSATTVRSPTTRDDVALLSSNHPLDVDAESNLVVTEPKLFVQLQAKSNRRVIANALAHCCLAGPVNESAKHTVLEALGCSDGKHFMILLRSHCQYSGLYSYSAAEDVASRVIGLGPRKFDNSMVGRYYKYDSGSKRFAEINSTSHLSTVVDGVMLKGKLKNKSSPAPPNE
ncbi:uncharacterized protein DEA37_0007779 [Paragonimus westermani]|uniref:CKK domain-containing protein n=1 Tax=Paragonimus westermani TaxID=34504 RepID=A0A5J4NSA0_9TREM|nr:uncharacterized protein DEA37_0007779 [Paragonimus westermani]